MAPPSQSQRLPSPSQPSGKGEVGELKMQLRQLAGSRAPGAEDLKRELYKKVISYMTIGIDVSSLFSEMVMCSATSDIVLKKMCYLYVGNYAKGHPDLALLTINFLQKDCQDDDPMIRGLALRSLCSLRVMNLVEYLVGPLRAGLQDSNSYVRTVAAIGALKLYHISPIACTESDFPAALKALLLHDPDAQVVASCLSSLQEILTLEGNTSEEASRERELLLSKPVIYLLLNRIKEFSEWAQCLVLDLISNYVPSENNEIFDIMNLLEDRLQHANSAVVLATINVFLHLTISMADVHQQVYERIKAPLLTLVSSGSSEVSYAVLSHLHLLVMRAPILFSSDYKHFYCRYSDPSYVKKLKLEMLTAVANENNTYDIVTELSEYAANVDVLIARESIRAVGKIALQQYDVNAIVDRLLQFLEMEKDYVTAETLVLVKDLLRKYPQWSHDCIAVVGNVSSKNVQEPKAKAALVWMLGEYSQDMLDAPYVLESLIDNWDEEDSAEVRSDSAQLARSDTAWSRIDSVKRVIPFRVHFKGQASWVYLIETMLRPKQFIPLCKGSRSLLVAASRNHSLDGGWVSCSEDDAHASGPRINSSTEEAANKCPILASSTAEKGFFKKDIKEATGSIIPAGVIEVDPQPRRFSFKDGMLKASLAADKYLKSYSGSSVPPVSSGGLVPRQCQESTKNGPVHNVGVIEVYQPTSFVDTFVRAGLATIDFLSGLADLNEAKYQNSNLLFMVNPDRPVSSIGVARGKSKSANFSSRTYTASPVEKTEGFELNALTRSNNSVLTQRPASDSYRAHLSSSKSTKRATHVAKTTRVDSANDLTQYQESLGSNPARNMNARGYISRIPVQGKPFENYSSSQTHLAHSTRKNEQLLCNLTPQVPPCGNATPLYGGRQASSKFSSRKFTTSTIAGNKPGRFQVDGNNLGTAGNLGRGINKVQGGGKKQIHAGAGQCNCLPVSGGSVEQVASILRQMNWGLAAEMALAKLNIKLDAYQVNQILKLQQEPGLALNFFYWSKRQPGFKHDGHSYTTMIGILGRARKFEAVKKLLDEMRRDGCEPNIVTYNRLIHCYGRANYTRDSVEIFYQMQEAGCKPDRVTYCTLIDIHAKAGFLDVAMDMYGKMQNAGLLPDTFTYSVIINCLGKAGDLYSAYKLFCEMIERGCVPNLVTYNIIIDLHAKARKYSTALKLYREMQNAGFYPDKVTYSIVMEVLGHCGHLEEAEAIFSEMQQADWIPDEPVYGLLVDLWGKAGNVQKASEWYSKMLNSGLRPNVPTCNSLLSAFLKVRMFNDAQKVLQTMLHLNLYPSFQTYTLLLSCCTDSQCQQDMDLCSSLMASTGHPTHSFLLSLPAAEPGGQNVREHVANFFDMMHSEDQESKRGLVDAVINFLHRADFKEEAGYVWEVAMQKNLYPHAVTQKAPMYWLINLHVMSMGTALIALSRTLAWFREHMLMSGVGPGRIDIITGWGRRSRVMGSSLVKQSVEHLLHIFGSPFYVENGNSGCFVGFGDPLIHWLHESYVERMHLL